MEKTLTALITLAAILTVLPFTPVLIVFGIISDLLNQRAARKCGEALSSAISAAAQKRPSLVVSE